MVKIALLGSRIIILKIIISAHMANIWPEICIWDVLDTFYVLFWYMEVIWCIFGKIEKKKDFLKYFLQFDLIYIYVYIMNPANYRPYDIAAGPGHLRAVFSQKCNRLCILVPPVTHILWFCEKVEKWPFLEYSRKTATVLLFCCRNVANQKVWNQGFLLHQESSPYLY